MTLPARDIPRHAVLTALSLVAIGAAANHFILPCTEDCGESRWIAAGSMQTARDLHTATLLNDGRVLVIGGRSTVHPFRAGTELYDPVSGNWSAGAELANPREGHTATLLQDGRVLVTGGYSASSRSFLTDTEIYEPATGRWAPAANMGSPRTWFAATALADGRVLVAGGWSRMDDYPATAAAEIFDPATGAWTPTGSMNVARYGHTLTLLPDGSVLAVRGSDEYEGVFTLASAERYDPVGGTWSFVAQSSVGSVGHTATLLPDGRVLVAGGFGGGLRISKGEYAIAELFDPLDGTWTRVGDLAQARYGHAAVVHANGEVLIAGGMDERGPYHGHPTLAATERFDPVARTWTRGPDLASPRYNLQLTLLRDGTVLATGGSFVELGADFTWAGVRTLATAERFQTAARAVAHPPGPPER